MIPHLLIENARDLRTPYVMPEICKDHIPLDWADLELIINLTPFVNTERLNIVNRTEPLHWPLTAWSTDNQAVPPSTIRKILKDKTVFIKDCSRLSKMINECVKDIEDIWKAPADAQVFFNTHNIDNGFGVHFDNNHNFIIQCEGESTIKVWNTELNDDDHKYSDVDCVEGKQRLKEIQDSKPAINHVMKPGDLVYIPKHHYHQYSANQKRLSLSIPIADYEDYEIRQDRDWISF